MDLKIEFNGGAELLFGNQKSHKVKVPPKVDDISGLLRWIRENLLKERPELFLQDDSVRPGILVLVNDTDWDLLDRENYKLQENDVIAFISTLHGG